MDTFITIFDYLQRILPGMVLIGLVFVLMKPDPLVRIVLYVFTFILLRDSMTPLKLWSFGATRGILWIRLSDDPLFLIIFGISCLMMTTALLYLDKEIRKYISLFLENRYTGMSVGVFGCLVVVAPYALLYQGVALTDRGGMVDSRLLLPLLTFAMLGNFLEEGLFRGYVLGVLKERNKPLVAGIYSGLVFALCHVFLATTVTDIGLSFCFSLCGREQSLV